MSVLPRNKEEVKQFVDGFELGDTIYRKAIEDGILAVIEASRTLDIDIWAFLKEVSLDTYPEGKQEYFFEIGKHMHIIHSCSSYAWTIRSLQAIAIEY